MMDCQPHTNLSFAHGTHAPPTTTNHQTCTTTGGDVVTDTFFGGLSNFLQLYNFVRMASGVCACVCLCVCICVCVCASVRGVWAG